MNRSNVRIREATAADLAAVVDLYNALIPTHTYTYREEPADVAELGAWFDAQRDNDFPVLVAELDGIVKADADADAAPDAEAIRAAAQAGRLDGTLESISLIVTDAALADCIEQLGDNAELPTSDQLRDVLPGVIERHGKEVAQLMLAATVAGDAPAAPIIRDLLKHDDLVKLPAAEPKPLSPVLDASKHAPDERAALKAKRAEAKKAKQEAARVAREQSARDRGRADRRSAAPPALPHPPQVVLARSNWRLSANSLRRVLAQVLPHQLRCCSDSSPTGAESPSGGWRCDTCRSAVNSRQFCR